MSLERFKTAQAADSAGLAQALAELRAGRKTSHWIWYVFPQLAGLGHSPTARFYALRDAEEARAYLDDPQLGVRLEEALAVAAGQLQAGIPVSVLMGGEIDALKLVSSATLFAEVARAGVDRTHLKAAVAGDVARNCAVILNCAERQGMPRCARTLAAVGHA